MSNTEQLLIERIQQMTPEEQQWLLNLIQAKQAESLTTNVPSTPLETEQHITVKHRTSQAQVPPKEMRLIRRLAALPPAEQRKLMQESADRAAQDGYPFLDYFEVGYDEED